MPSPMTNAEIIKEAVQRVQEPPAPKQGVQQVMTKHSAQQVKSAFKYQFQKGLDTYGQALRTFDGRDAGTDLLLEQVDTIIYGLKLTEERNTLYDLLIEAVELLAVQWRGNLETEDLQAFFDQVEACTDISVQSE